MKNVFFAVMALAVSFTETRAADSPAIVPMPQHIAYATGEGAVLSAGSRIAVPGGAKALRSVAELFVRDICREHGLRLKVSGISESGIVDSGLIRRSGRRPIRSTSAKGVSP